MARVDELLPISGAKTRRRAGAERKQAHIAQVAWLRAREVVERLDLNDVCGALVVALEIGSTERPRDTVRKPRLRFEIDRIERSAPARPAIGGTAEIPLACR